MTGIFMKTSEKAPEYWLKVEIADTGLRGYVKPGAVKNFDIEEYKYDEEEWVYMFRERTPVGNRMVTTGRTYDGHTNSAIDIKGDDNVNFREKEYPIYSPMYGTVVALKNFDGNFPNWETYNVSDKTNGYGNYVIIENDKYKILLAHFEFAPLVSIGDQVTPHTMLGMVGNTGWSEGYHLHLELYDKNMGGYKYPKNYFSEIT